MRKSEWFLVGIAAIFFITGILFYPYLPAVVASHWNAAGEVNGYLPRFWGVFLLPFIFVVLALLLTSIPRIDPKKANIAKFRNYFDIFIEIFAVIFYYLYLLVLFRNIGYQFDFVRFLVPAFALLFYAIGAILPHTELNFTIGIRTPWTISSETVWRKTHDVGGVVFKICAVIMLLGMLVPSLAIWFIFVPLVVAAIGLVIYSYILYEGEKR